MRGLIATKVLNQELALDKLRPFTPRELPPSWPTSHRCRYLEFVHDLLNLMFSDPDNESFIYGVLAFTRMLAKASSIQAPIW